MYLNYVHVVDPGSGTGVEKMMPWNLSTIYGYYIITVY